MTDKVSIDQRGAEEPDDLQVMIKASMTVIDLGCGSLEMSIFADGEE